MQSADLLPVIERFVKEAARTAQLDHRMSRHTCEGGGLHPPCSIEVYSDSKRKAEQRSAFLRFAVIGFLHFARVEVAPPHTALGEYS